MNCCVWLLQVPITVPDWYTSLLICIMREAERVSGQAFCAQTPMAESLRNFARSRWVLGRPGTYLEVMLVCSIQL